MLTIKKLIALKIGRDIRTLPEKLNNTIEQNYSILAANIKSEDLLFLLTNPMQETVEDNNYQTTNILSSVSSNQNMQVQILNNFVNRIFSYGTADFTYQDSVYISTILNKLGITNVGEFIQEVKNINESTENVNELMSLYEKNIEFLKLANQYEGNTINQKNQSAVEKSHIHNDCYLQNEIYNRLDTSQIYETVYNFTHPTQTFNSKVLNEQILMTEQIRAFKQLKLMSLKIDAGIIPEAVFNEQASLYEKHENINALSSREAVLASGVAAALISSINNLIVNKKEKNFGHSNVWIDASQAFYQIAENSVRRFQLYSQEYISQESKHISNVWEINQNYKEEIAAFVKLKQEMLPNEEHFVEVTKELHNITEKNQHEKESNHEEIITKSAKINQPISETVNHYKEEINAVTNPQKIEQFNVKTITNKYEQAHEYNQTDEETLLLEQSSQTEITEENSLFSTQTLVNQVDNLLNKNVNQEIHKEQAFIKQLQEINENNVQLHNRLTNNQTIQKKVKSVTKADTKKIMNAALKAIDNPEEAIAEFFNDIIVDNQPINFTNLYPQIESLNEESKKIYEALILMKHDPQKAEELGIISKGNFGQLLSDLNTKAVGDKAGGIDETFKPADIINNIENTIVPSEVSKQLTEIFNFFTERKGGDMSARQIGPSTAGQTFEDGAKKDPITPQELAYLQSLSVNNPDMNEKIKNTVTEIVGPIEYKNLRTVEEDRVIYNKIPFIHKQVNDINEEIVEELNKFSRKKEVATVTQVEEKNVSLSKTEINNISKTVLEKTGENIATTIERAISSQLDTITNKVYNQLERKLSNERMRRGY